MLVSKLGTHRERDDFYCFVLFGEGVGGPGFSGGRELLASVRAGVYFDAKLGRNNL